MICAVGELLIDFMQKDINGFGYPVLSANPGGAPANFLCAAVKAGVGASFIGKVGKDAFGELLKKTLAEKEIDVKGLREDSSVFTTLAFVTLDGNGERSFSFARKPGADTCLCFDEIDLSLIDECSIFHFGSLSFTAEPSKTAVIKAVEYAKSKGKIISYDPNYRPSLWENEENARENMLLGFNYADTVKLSIEEAMFLFGAAYEESADILIDKYGASLVFITMGEKGCYYKNRNCSGFAESEIKVTPVDTTGAGDIFGGTAAAMILNSGKHPSEFVKEELHSIATASCTVASLSTEHYGGM